ncbi:ATP-grasp fold amidoligase family protein [Vibrio crassostreae]|uniref:ATP-grasp fold amidoligase family protein n=1 Tax=Vibrio crassostreae TaxID=246167 RepID=UPI001FEF600F|nr:ATP-grasp fold amidoligase family protein [Vibrio crassostreae]
MSSDFLVIDVIWNILWWRMRKFLKYLVRDWLRLVLGRVNYVKLRFVLTHGYRCDLENPKTWNEKIQYRKLNTPPEKFSKFVDKFEVRKYVSDKIGIGYLIPLIAKFKIISPSDFDDLPNQFVIKTSNGGGGENVKIVYDKNNEDLKNLSEQFNGYLSNKIGSKIDELFYDIEEPYILIEKLMLDKNGQLPCDYKCHIFNNETCKVFVQVDQGRFVNHCRSIYDENGLAQDFKIQPKYNVIPDFDFPENFSQLINQAKILASEFDYVRVDMYLINGCVFFGEMTFCHGSGWEPVYPRESDKVLGSYWNP